MIPNDPTLRKEMIDRMIKVCRCNLDTLSSWEEGFVDSITEQFEARGNLSPKQCEILEKIYDKCQ